MIHRESGVFKTSYIADMAVFPLPVAQWSVAALAAVFVVIVPAAFSEYHLSIVNLVMIALVMVPSFRDHVSPKIPRKLGKGYYALATAHATLGSIVQCGGLYIVLVAGTKIVPEKFRIRRYKFWMRCALVGWWVVLALGLTTYARWYVPHLFRR